MLIKRTLSNMSIYTMSLFWMSKKVRTRLEKIQRDILLGGGNMDIGKFTWSTWK